MQVWCWLLLAALSLVQDAPRIVPVETDATRAMAKHVRERVDAAKALRESGKADEARAIVRSVLDEALATPGREKSDALNRALDQLSREAIQSFDEQTVIRAAEPCLAYRIAAQGPDHLDVQDVRGNLANSYWATNQFERGRALLDAQLEVFARTLEPDNPRVLDAKSNYAVILAKQNDYEGARALLSEVVDALLANHSAGDPSIQWALANYANVLDRLGDTQGALAYLERVHATLSATLAADSADLAIARENLATTLRANGDPAAARFLLQEVLTARTKHYPAGHRSLKRTRLNLANAFDDLGDYQSARLLLEGLVAEHEADGPDDDPDLNLARGNLASVLLALGDLDGAFALHEKVLEVNAETYGPDHALTIDALASVAATHEERGELDAAYELGSQACERLKALGDSAGMRLIYADASLARVLARLGRVDEAIVKAREVLAALTQRFEPSHPNVVRGELVLAGYIEERDPPAALTMIRAASLRVLERLRAVGSAMAPREAELYTQKLGGLVEPIISRLVAPEDAAFCLELIETARAAPLVSTRALRALDEAAAGDVELSRLRDELRRVSARVAALAHEGAQAEYRAAALERSALEQRLGRAEGFAQRIARPAARAVDFAAALGERAAAVSYRRFSAPPVSAFDGALEPARFVAFVLRADRSVTRVEIGPAAAIEERVAAWRRAIGVDAAAATAEAARAEGEALRKLVLDPVLASAPGLERLTLVADDVLHLVPFDALPHEHGAVGDTLEIVRRESLIDSEATAPLAADLLAIGGVDFDAAASVDEPEERAGELREPAPIVLAAAERMSLSTASFAPLVSSLDEATAVAALFDSREGEHGAARLFTGRSASKAALSQHAANARYVHIATHGFFDAGGAGERVLGAGAREDAFAAQIRGLSPRVLCGLALAGANRPRELVDRGAGVLTAEELAYLDLDGCELAVLSACDTSAGLRRSGIGLASLSSALRAAGARHTLTSLWRVSDAASHELMREFYAGLWRDGLDARTALWRAKSKLRERRAPTRDWAGWLLVEG